MQGSHLLETQHFSSPYAFQRYANDFTWLLGHNLWAHDLRLLEKLEAPFFAPQSQLIDTLYLSALLSQRSKQAESRTIAYILTELKQALPWTHAERSLHQVDEALRQLHHLEVLHLESGLSLFYNRLEIRRKKTSKERFTKSDYAVLSEHYQHKVQQIHLMEHYARRLIEAPDQARDFVQDYFELPFQDFLKQHFPDKKAREDLNRPLTHQQHHDIGETFNSTTGDCG